MYEYKCHVCGTIFEVRQKFSDEPLTTHEGCGGTVERLISAPAFQFKGSGWYVTDYAKGGSSTSGGAKPSGGDSAKSESGKGESSSKGDSGKSDSGSSGSAGSSSNSGSSSTSASSDKK